MGRWSRLGRRKSWTAWSTRAKPWTWQQNPCCALLCWRTVTPDLLEQEIAPAQVPGAARRDEVTYRPCRQFNVIHHIRHFPQKAPHAENGAHSVLGIDSHYSSSLMDLRYARNFFVCLIAALHHSESSKGRRTPMRKMGNRHWS